MKRLGLLFTFITLLGLLVTTNTSCGDDNDSKFGFYVIPVNASTGSPSLEFFIDDESVGSATYGLAGVGRSLIREWAAMQIDIKNGNNKVGHLSYDDNKFEHRSIYAYGAYPNLSIAVLSDEYPDLGTKSGVRLINLNPAYKHVNLVDLQGNLIQGNRVYDGDTTLLGSSSYFNFKTAEAGTPQFLILDSETGDTIKQASYEVEQNVGVTIFLHGLTTSDAAVGFVWHD
ncbi:MAG: hypothetical protein KDC76_10985 [Bacteroidetes bacterium]|nr:hypothetical protein [Bacteroidota bacterium]